MVDVEARFGDAANDPKEPLTRWRRALSRLSDNGARDGFSNAFTRTTGLEVVTPLITSAGGPPVAVLQGSTFPIRWDCRHNPPATSVSVRTVSPAGAVTSWAGLPMSGQSDMPAVETGTYVATITAALTVNGRTRHASSTVAVTVVPDIN